MDEQTINIIKAAQEQTVNAIGFLRMVAPRIPETIDKHHFKAIGALLSADKEMRLMRQEREQPGDAFS